MKTGMSSLSGDSLLQSIRDQFKLVKDHRDKNRISIELLDFLMSGFAIFALKFPSLLKFEEEMRDRNLASHLSPLFKLQQVPSDTHLRTVLDEIELESLSPIFKKLFNHFQRSNHLKEFQFLEGKYILCIDGTQFFASDKIHCDSCMVKKTRDDSKSEGVKYYHQMLAGCLVHPNKECVIPFAPEPMHKQDGNDKNDNERPALRRFLDRLRADHPKLPLILTADALHSNGPLIRDLKLYNIDYILSVKSGSHIKLFEGIDKWEERGKLKYYTFEEEIGDKIKKKRIHQLCPSGSIA